MLENGSDLHVNERQKIRHYHARRTEEEEEEEERKKNNAKSPFLLHTERIYIALLW